MVGELLINLSLWTLLVNLLRHEADWEEVFSCIFTLKEFFALLQEH